MGNGSLNGLNSISFIPSHQSITVDFFILLVVAAGLYVIPHEVLEPASHFLLALQTLVKWHYFVASL